MDRLNVFISMVRVLSQLVQNVAHTKGAQPGRKGEVVLNVKFRVLQTKEVEQREIQLSRIPVPVAYAVYS